jgi:hypothetical protein
MRGTNRRASVVMIGWLGAACALVAAALIRELPSLYRYLEIRQM